MPFGDKLGWPKLPEYPQLSHAPLNPNMGPKLWEIAQGRQSCGPCDYIGSFLAGREHRCQEPCLELALMDLNPDFSTDWVNSVTFGWLNSLPWQGWIKCEEVSGVWEVISTLTLEMTLLESRSRMGDRIRKTQHLSFEINCPPREKWDFQSQGSLPNWIPEAFVGKMISSIPQMDRRTKKSLLMLAFTAQD